MIRRLKPLKLGVLSVGLGCSFFLSLILSEVSLVRNLEFVIQDRLTLWQGFARSFVPLPCSVTGPPICDRLVRQKEKQ